MTMTPEQRVEDAAREVWLVAATFPGREERWLELSEGDREPYFRYATAALASSEKLIAELEVRIAAMRAQRQSEGFASAVHWLRERSAMKPPATLWSAAEILAGQMEQSRIPALNEDKPHD
jgi:hypothetical protein